MTREEAAQVLMNIFDTTWEKRVYAKHDDLVIHITIDELEKLLPAMELAISALQYADVMQVSQWEESSLKSANDVTVTVTDKHDKYPAVNWWAERGSKP